MELRKVLVKLWEGLDRINMSVKLIEIGNNVICYIRVIFHDRI